MESLTIQATPVLATWDIRSNKYALMISSIRVFGILSPCLLEMGHNKEIHAQKKRSRPTLQKQNALCLTPCSLSFALYPHNEQGFPPCSSPSYFRTDIPSSQHTYHTPRANAICEHFLRSVRQECLDHLLIFREKQLQRVLTLYVSYFDQARPHQGIEQQIPDPSRSSRSSLSGGDKVIAVPILSGLHHDYQRIA